jgi:hypothetical protein
MSVVSYNHRAGVTTHIPLSHNQNSISKGRNSNTSIDNMKYRLQIDVSSNSP